MQGMQRQRYFVAALVCCLLGLCNATAQTISGVSRRPLGGFAAQADSIYPKSRKSNCYFAPEIQKSAQKENL